MRVDLLTREFAPESYGGAGAHVDNVARLLRRDLTLRVHCFGSPRADTIAAAYQASPTTSSVNIALAAAEIGPRMAAAVAGADVVNSHTWYTNHGGHLAKLYHNIPHVLTAHSLEPMRPWKAEGFAGGYRLSGDFERLAMQHADRIIAASRSMADDIVQCYPEVERERIALVPNGVDAQLFAPGRETRALDRFGLRSAGALVVCVGRISPQKGLTYLLEAAEYFPSGTQLVIVADTADNDVLRHAFARRVAEAQGKGLDVLWLGDRIPKQALAGLLGRADVFVCPSIYEPQGIVNLEAMSCGTPVVATAVGGIPEVVIDKRTGLLIPLTGLEIDAAGMPTDGRAFGKEIALRVNELIASPDTARSMGAEGRRVAVRSFGWERVANGVREVFASAIEGRPLPDRLTAACR